MTPDAITPATIHGALRCCWPALLLLSQAHAAGDAQSDAEIAVVLREAQSLIDTQQYAEANHVLTISLSQVRRDGGLYDPRQFEMLQALIDVDARTGRIEAALGNLGYLERVSAGARGTASLRHAAMLTWVGEGFCRLGNFFGGRARHRIAMALAADAHGDDAQRVTALLGIVRCALHELAVQGISTASTPLEDYRGPIARSPQADPGELTFRYRMGRLLNAEAENALIEAARLAATSPALPHDMAVATLLHAGDWFLVKDHLNTARDYYLQALQVAGESEAGTMLSTPVRILYAFPVHALPQLRATPDANAARSVVVEFTVGANGVTRDERVLRRAVSKSLVEETLAAVRSARYRPRFVQGKPVATPGMQLTQAYAPAR